ncbi:hypothetical protein GCM10027517_37040 [Phycicoccus ginsengisoli]
MRLRRTLAGTVLLLLLVLLTVRLVGRGQSQEPTAFSSPTRPAAAGSATAGSKTAGSAPAASSTRATGSTAAGTNNEDGSSGSDTTPGDPAAVPQQGTGAISVVAVPAVANDVPGRTVRYTVEVEGGLGVTESEVARTVQSVLLDPKGWQGVDRVRFVNVTPAQAAAGAKVDIRVTLASPSLTDKLCAPLQTLSQVSCWNGERSVLNFRRWALGDDSYGSDVARYRVYQVNHEVGHGLGHAHRGCPGKGERAPVMVQQTLSLGGCEPWPYPSGA